MALIVIFSVIGCCGPYYWWSRKKARERFRGGGSTTFAGGSDGGGGGFRSGSSELSMGGSSVLGGRTRFRDEHEDLADDDANDGANRCDHGGTRKKNLFSRFLQKIRKGFDDRSAFTQNSGTRDINGVTGRISSWENFENRGGNINGHNRPSEDHLPPGEYDQPNPKVIGVPVGAGPGDGPDRVSSGGKIPTGATWGGDKSNIAEGAPDESNIAAKGKRRKKKGPDFVPDFFGAAQVPNRADEFGTTPVLEKGNLFNSDSPNSTSANYNSTREESFQRYHANGPGTNDDAGTTHDAGTTTTTGNSNGAGTNLEVGGELTGGTHRLESETRRIMDEIEREEVERNPGFYSGFYTRSYNALVEGGDV